MDCDPNIIRVNRDDIRIARFRRYAGLSQAQENAVSQIQFTEARQAIDAGHDVIVDDTNLTSSARARWRAFANLYGASFRLVPFLVDVETCVARCEQRALEDPSRRISRQVVERMAARFVASLEPVNA